MILSPGHPVYNSIIFYIIIICLVLLIKPNFMYCKKTQKFKTFGISSKHTTIVTFPIFSITVAILLYMIFLCISILNKLLDK